MARPKGNNHTSASVPSSHSTSLIQPQSNYGQNSGGGPIKIVRGANSIQRRSQEGEQSPVQARTSKFQVSDHAIDTGLPDVIAKYGFKTRTGFIP